MADLRISELSTGGAAQAADELPVSRTAGVATRKVTAQTIADLAASAIAAAVSLEISARVAGDASLAQGISVVSVAVAVVSNAVSNEASVRAVSVQTASAAATSADAHAAAASAAATSVAAVASLAISVVSNIVSVLSDAHTSLVNRVSANSGAGGGGSATPTSAGYLSLVDRVSANSGVGGGGSVTSTEVSAGDASVAAAASLAISVVSHAVSVLSQQNSVEHAALSNAVSVASAAATSADAHAAAASAAATSIAAVGSLAVSVVSHAVSVLSQANSVAHAALSNGISVASAAATSADAHAAAASAAATSIAVVGSLAVSVVSHAVSVLSQANSVAHAALSNAVSVASAAATSVDQRVSVLSTNYTSLVNRVSANSGAGGGGGSVTSDELSAVGTLSLQNLDSVALSAGAPVYAFTSANTMKRALASATVEKRVIGLVLDNSLAVSAVGRIKYGGIMSLTTAQWDAITGGSGGLTIGTTYYLDDTTRGRLRATAPTLPVPARPVGVALTTTEMKLQIPHGDDWNATSIAADVSNLISAVAAISTNVSALSTAVSVVSVAAAVVSEAVSALSVAVAAAGGFQQRSFVTTGLTVSAATLTNIPSLSLSLAASAMYDVTGAIFFQAGTSGGFGFGLSLPAMGPRGSHIEMVVPITEGQASAAFGATTWAKGYMMLSAEAAGQSTVVSTVISVINAPRVVQITGQLNTSAAGTMQLMARTSVAAANLQIRGGYIKAYRIL